MANGNSVIFQGMVRGQVGVTEVYDCLQRFSHRLVYFQAPVRIEVVDVSTKTQFQGRIPGTPLALAKIESTNNFAGQAGKRKLVACITIHEVLRIPVRRVAADGPPSRFGPDDVVHHVTGNGSRPNHPKQ